MGGYLSLFGLILLRMSDWQPFWISVTVYLCEKHSRKVAFYIA